MDTDQSDNQATNRQQKKEAHPHKPVKALGEWRKQIWASFKIEARSAKFWVELFALIGLGIYTAFAALQWRANKEAADAAKSAADSAVRQLTDFENVQRAKLVLQFADEHEVYERDGDLYIRGVINIQNVGQTPALQFVFRHGDFGVRNAPEKCPSTYEVIQQIPMALHFQVTKNGLITTLLGLGMPIR